MSSVLAWSKTVFNLNLGVHVGLCLRKLVCNVCAPYSADWNFPQCSYAILCPSHPLTSMQNFTEIVPCKGTPPSGVMHKRSSQIYRRITLDMSFVHPTQPIEIFHNVPMPFCTPAIHWPPCKILRRLSHARELLRWALCTRGVAKYIDV